MVPTWEWFFCELDALPDALVLLVGGVAAVVAVEVEVEEVL